MLTASRQNDTEASGRRSHAPPDVSLVVDAQAGSLSARQMLFDRHLDRTRGFAFRLLGRDQDLNDVVQECMVSALESLGNLRNPKHFSSWLGAVLINTVRVTLVRRRRRTRLLRPVNDPISMEAVPFRGLMPDEAAELGRFLCALQQLPEKQRVAWILRRVESYSVLEIAEALCCSQSTVKRWFHAAEAVLTKRATKKSVRLKRKARSQGRTDEGTFEAVGP